MKDSLPNEFIDSAVSRLEYYKSLADQAVAQTSDENLRRPLDEHTNSIAVIMKHLAGNMRSRWTDFLTTDGEKPWRHRDREFVDDFSSRREIVEYWEAGWNCCLDAIHSLSAGDLVKSVAIRGEEHSVIDAINRQLIHYGYHVGQIVLMARHYAGDDWETLTIPRGGSEAYNRKVGYEFPKNLQKTSDH